MDRRLLRGPGARLPEPRKRGFGAYIRRYWSILVLVFTCAAVFAALSVVKLHFVFDDPDAVSRVVHIERGMNVRAIADLLEREGIIESPLFFRAWVRFKGVAGQLKAGRFRLQSNYPVPVVVNELVHGRALTRSITVPEGLTMRQIAGLMHREGGLDSARFHNLCTDPAFVTGQDVFGAPATLEGFLYPETYVYDPDTDEKGVITMMTRMFKRVFLEEYAAAAGSVTMPNYEVLVLASIVEREAKLPDERPKVAAVFHNRLKINKYLESCATVNYIRTDILGLEKRDVLWNKDLKIKSPYNTYMRYGLPPAPICNPGRAALRATMQPADIDALYFVSKGDGSHHFSRTLRGHINAKNQFKKNY